MTTKDKRPGLAATKTKGATNITKQRKHIRFPTRCKCPQCGASMPIAALLFGEWVPDLQMLAARFSGTGITPDLGAMCACNLFGAYIWLLRQAG